MNVMNFGYSSSFQAIDKGLIEQIGPTGFTNSVSKTSANFIGYNSGFLFNAIFFFLSFAFLSFVAFVLNF